MDPLEWGQYKGSLLFEKFFFSEQLPKNTIEKRCRDQSELPLEWGHYKDSLPCCGT